MKEVDDKQSKMEKECHKNNCLIYLFILYNIIIIYRQAGNYFAHRQTFTSDSFFNA